MIPALSDKQVLDRLECMKKRHRSEWCQLVFEASAGRSIHQVAQLLGHSPRWVQEHLDGYAVDSAIRGGGPAGLFNEGPKREEVRAIIKKYGPEEPDAEYVAEYEAQRYTPEVAKRLARAYGGAENAIDKGVLKPPGDKGLTKIVLPQGVDWTMRLRRACADVGAAAGLLDRAKMTDLKRAETRKQVAAVHAKWMEQIERIENLHPTFQQEVSTHEA